MIHHYPHVFAGYNSFFTTVVGQEVGFILHTFLVDGFKPHKQDDPTRYFERDGFINAYQSDDIMIIMISPMLDMFDRHFTGISL
jgi:hypothetical protein